MDLTPPAKVPKKKAPVKRQASVLWEDLSCQESPQEQKLTELVLQLQKRLNSLELGLQALQEAMDHLLQEDSTDHTLSEDELN